MTRKVVLGCVLACALPSTTMVQARAVGTQDSATAAEEQSTAALEKLFWESVMNSRNPADFRAYLDEFPDGIFKTLARNRVQDLEAETTGGATQPCDHTPFSDTGCWTNVYDPTGASRPDCLVWNPDPGTYPIATWTGDCAAGVAHGFGTLEWRQDADSWAVQGQGVLQNGFQTGHWQLTHDDGLRVDAEYAPNGRILRSRAPLR